MSPERRLRRIIAACEQSIIDITYWNSINPNESPIDVEPERVLAHKAREALAAFKRGDIGKWKSLANELVSYASVVTADRSDTDA